MGLGIDVQTSDMCYMSYKVLATGYLKTIDVLGDNVDLFPAWSLSALVDLMPERITIGDKDHYENYYLGFKKKAVEYKGPITWDGQKSKMFARDNLIDAAFEMICWLLRSKKL
jgi:hypothetical protein